MKKIGIFGGVFNPPHNSHFTVAEEILNNHPEFEKIFFMPVGDKYKKPEIIPAEHRYNMLKLACTQNDKLEVSDFEIKQQEQFYAYQTLDAFQKLYPDHKLCFIIGTDSLKTFETWKRYEYLLQNYEILVYPRGNDNAKEILEKHPILNNVKDLFKFANCEISTNTSSTIIRENFKKGNKLHYLIPEPVMKYIEKNKLYR